MIRDLSEVNPIKMLKLLKSIILILFTLTGISCLTDPVELGEHDDYVAQFDLVWRTFDQKYIGFIFLDLDWDAVYNQYRPEVGEIQSQQELTDLLLEMFALLEDLHVWIITPDETYLFSYTPGYWANYSMPVLWTYIDSLSTGGFTFWDADSVWGYAMFDSIPYVMVTGMVEYLNFAHLSNLIDNVPDAPAMIIDVRMNSGGHSSTAYQLLRRICTEGGLAYYWVRRNGPEHDDLSEPEPVYNYPLSTCFDRPVMVLMGGGCASATEGFLLRADVLPQVILAGDATRREVNANAQPYSELAGGYEFSIPICTILSADSSTWIQETGIAPDVYIEATYRDFSQGVDPVLEYALEWAASQ